MPYDLIDFIPFKPFLSTTYEVNHCVVLMMSNVSDISLSRAHFRLNLLISAVIHT